MTLSVYCVAHSDSHANLIIEELKDSGFAADQISVLFDISRPLPDIGFSHSFEYPMYMGTGGEQYSDLLVPQTHEPAIGWVNGIGMLAVPRIGPMIAAGRIMMALTDNGWDGVAAALIELGVTKSAAIRYENRVSEGDILISIHTDDPIQTRIAREIFSSANADEISDERDLVPDYQEYLPYQ